MRPTPTVTFSGNGNFAAGSAPGIWVPGRGGGDISPPHSSFIRHLPPRRTYTKVYISAFSTTWLTYPCQEGCPSAPDRDRACKRRACRIIESGEMARGVQPSPRSPPRALGERIKGAAQLRAAPLFISVWQSGRGRHSPFIPPVRTFEPTCPSGGGQAHRSWAP